MSTERAEDNINLDCLIDAIEEALCATLDAALMRKAWFADVGIDSALRASMRELGVALYELGGLEAMKSALRAASLDEPRNSEWRTNYLNKCWDGIGDQRGRWLR
jgi:hypothetical protein